MLMTHTRLHSSELSEKVQLYAMHAQRERAHCLLYNPAMPWVLYTVGKVSCGNRGFLFLVWAFSKGKELWTKKEHMSFLTGAPHLQGEWGQCGA